MTNLIPPPSSTGAPGVGGSFNITDFMTFVQILLVQDYDDQLRSMANQMKGISKIKNAYRQDIEKLQKFLMKPSKERGGDGTHSETIEVYKNELDILNTSFEHLIQNGEMVSVPTEMFGTIKPVQQKGGTRGDPIRRYFVTKEAIESKIENVKSKLDSFNEQSELNSLQLQTLTSQRKIAFETISNITSKHHDTLSLIVRNMKG